ncbi:hypothetical protein [Lysinibacillus fusiformis]|uniref:hypothetical protein n=1 Tax=Lysinibacillus fusiformis TaxID=28031 RepID=UPI00088CAB77|nr:hypothetical protein [Lysinibacillus fusiformis]SCX52035.1 hypothetical protein SAMN02787108_01859 [Lysinibacillus fusiformis]SDB27764.1 hypothetical protein SAMN02787070_02003 [Lysinibacillus fusiformis]SFI22092.1 hypothetical protein SAMN02787080_02002 [Lysinibacillus fusiformis]SFS82295.1 hypothetical protein SAMN02787099_01737 [Lysinibacillus fusiformis]
MNLWEAYEKVDKHLNEKLLTIPPYPCVSGKKVQELLDSLENPDPAWGGLDGEILRMVKNPWQRAYQVEYRFKPTKIFNDFMKIIESATYDLMIGNYICSYLSLVPVVEAILRKWSIDKSNEIESVNKKGDFSIYVFEKNLVKYLNEKNNERHSNIKFQKWISNQIKYFDFMIREVFYLRFNASEDGVKKEFNRNRTLHLLDNIEDTVALRDNNTRIFLLLDIIAELYLSLDEELYVNNTFYAEYEKNIDFNLRWKIYLKNAMESIHHTDMTIIQFAFLQQNKKYMSDEQKQKLIEQKELQIQLIQSKR